MKSMFSGGGVTGGNMYYGREIGLHGADTSFSSYIGLKKAPMELSNLDDEEEEEMFDDMDDILEFRVYRRGKYCLVETLEKIADIDERAQVKLRMRGQSEPKGYTSGIYEDDAEQEDEDPLAEFSGTGAVAGYITPLRGSKKDLKKQARVGYGAKFS